MITSVDDVRLYDLLSKISKLNSLHKIINEQPVHPEWREKTQKMGFLRAVQGTIALEGSELELEENLQIVVTCNQSLNPN